MCTAVGLALVITLLSVNMISYNKQSLTWDFARNISNGERRRLETGQQAMS